ncbi:Plus3 domain-containing protein [Abeliophyllum distichum]|uniref:Plus3 domain-containing protein n=1 Tax=Abeliophyllum distichum TaxID=126358 RepID=A0ABD1S8S3_9LAMI
MDVPSIKVEEDPTKLREAYRIPADIELILPGPNERACFPRRGCTSLHLNAFVSGMRLPLHPMLRRILRAYNLAPTQPRKLPRRKSREEEVGWYYFYPWGSHKSLVISCPFSIKQWKESWFWVSRNWQRVFDDPEPNLDVPSVYGIANLLPRCELSRDIVDVLRSIYQANQKSRSYELILNRRRCLVELRLMASKDTSQRKAIEDLSREENKEAVEASKVIEVDDTPEVEVPLSRKRKARTARTETSQAKRSVVEVVDNYVVCSAPLLQRTLAVNTSGEVVLEGPSRSTLTPGGGDSGPFDSKRRLRELIGAPGARIPDDALWNLPFYPSMGAQAVKKYFTPKWEEFFVHGELEDVLEASLASAIRASAMQLKVLGEFRTRMQEQKKLIVEASKPDKEHK